MKNILSILALSLFTGINAQVIIGGGTAGTAAVKTSVLLEFAPNLNKGIIVPYVRSLPTGAAAVGGSILLDATTATTARMKYYNGTAWIDLSGQDANLTTILTSQPTATVAPETAASKAIIGAATSTADGVLVLESTTKAMVLPVVGTVTLSPGVLSPNVVSPSPGMMVYINTAGAKRLAVYNGSKWSFFRATPTP